MKISYKVVTLKIEIGKCIDLYYHATMYYGLKHIQAESAEGNHMWDTLVKEGKEISVSGNSILLGPNATNHESTELSP